MCALHRSLARYGVTTFCYKPHVHLHEQGPPGDGGATEGGGEGEEREHDPQLAPLRAEERPSSTSHCI